MVHNFLCSSPHTSKPPKNNFETATRATKVRDTYSVTSATRRPFLRSSLASPTSNVFRFFVNVFGK